MPRGYLASWTVLARWAVLARWTVLAIRAVYPPEGGADPYIMPVWNCQRRGENFTETSHQAEAARGAEQVVPTFRKRGNPPFRQPLAMSYRPPYTSPNTPAS